MMRCAIFDLDGTLLDSSDMWRTLGQRYLGMVGVSPAEGLTEALYEMSLSDSARYLRETYSLPYSSEEIVRQFSRMTEQFYREQVTFKEGAPRLLAMLRSRCVRMSVATAGDAALGMAALTRLGVADFFAGAVSCTEYGAKTSPEVYYAAADLMCAVPQETVVFEDSLYAVRSANKGGFRTAAVFDIGEASQKELEKSADFYAETLDIFADDLGRILA